MNRSDSSFGASSLSSWSLDNEESLSKSSKVGDGGGDGDGGVGSLGGIIPCFLKASLLEIGEFCARSAEVNHPQFGIFIWVDGHM